MSKLDTFPPKSEKIQELEEFISKGYYKILRKAKLT